jgi:hypothetical protein
VRPWTRCGPTTLSAVAMGLFAFGCGGSGGHAAASPSPSPIIAIPVAPVVAAPAGCPTGATVSDATQLRGALGGAKPGDVIVLTPGLYAGHFIATSSGTTDAPITLCGGRDATLDGGSIKTGYTVYLNGASWWRLVGFSVQGGQKGVVTDHANHVLISGLYVHDVGDEAIHLRSFSSDNTVEGVTIRATGKLRSKFGEGIYIGTANSNWCKYTGCQPDASDRNVVRNNDISQTTAENIDVKEGTSAGQIVDNLLSGAGMVSSAATAWVNVKGNDWTIDGNVGRDSIKDGFQVHRVYQGWGARNVFRSNRAEVNGPGFGFYVQSAALATVVACDNVAIGAALGLTNTSCAK